MNYNERHTTIFMDSVKKITVKFYKKNTYSYSTTKIFDNIVSVTILSNELENRKVITIMTLSDKVYKFIKLYNVAYFSV